MVTRTSTIQLAATGTYGVCTADARPQLGRHPPPAPAAADEPKPAGALSATFAVSPSKLATTSSHSLRTAGCTPAAELHGEDLLDLCQV